MANCNWEQLSQNTRVECERLNCRHLSSSLARSGICEVHLENKQLDFRAQLSRRPVELHFHETSPIRLDNLPTLASCRLRILELAIDFVFPFIALPRTLHHSFEFRLQRFPQISTKSGSQSAFKGHENYFVLLSNLRDLPKSTMMSDNIRFASQFA